jgi:hypothetical protein
MQRELQKEKKMQHENRQNGNPRKYPFIMEGLRHYVKNDAGLEGIDREVAKAQLYIARAISRLRQAVNVSEAEFIQLVKSATSVSDTMVGRYVALGDAYFPTDPEKLRFQMTVLSGMGCKRLKAFLPYLNELYDNEASPLRQRIRLTQWSIEALFGNGGCEGEKWIDLRTLDVESVRDLRNFILTPPTTQSPASGIRRNTQAVTDRDTAADLASANEIDEAFRPFIAFDDPFFEKLLAESFENMSL